MVVWITGGGSGIGLACAVAYAKRGAVVVVSGRREDKLRDAVAQIQAAGGTGMALACDVADEASVAAAVAAIVAAHGRLDVVLANAGFSVTGPVEGLSDADWRRQFDVNVFGLLHTARHALPELRKSQGRIALVSSVMTWFFPRKHAAYAASKAAVHAIGQTLSLELEGSGVSCTTIYPGFVESEIAQVDNTGVHDATRKDRRPKQLMWTADDAAGVIVRAIDARRRELVFTGHGKLVAAAARFAPWLVRWAAAKA